MTNQNITLLKTEKFVNQYPYIIFFQHNNLSVKDWSQLRIQLGLIENVDLLVLKNTLIETVILKENKSKNKSIKNLFQGPCFAIGFLNMSQLSEIINLSKKLPNIYLLGGLYNNILLNHLDIEKFLQLDNQVYNKFLFNLNQSQMLYTTLQNSMNFSFLQQIPINLLYCLEILKNKKL